MAEKALKVAQGGNGGKRWKVPREALPSLTNSKKEDSMGLCLDKEDGLPDGLLLEIRRESIWIIDDADPMSEMYCGEAGSVRSVEVTKKFLKLVLETFKDPRFAEYLEEWDD